MNTHLIKDEVRKLFLKTAICTYKRQKLLTAAADLWYMLLKSFSEESSLKCKLPAKIHKDITRFHLISVDSVTFK